MLDTGPRLSSEARLRCSSGPPVRTGGDAPIPALTSTEPQLFLAVVSLSRPILNHMQKRTCRRFIFSLVLFCVCCEVPEVSAPLNSRRSRKSENLGIIGVIVHLDREAVV